jgi:hypothetical protein
MKAADAHARVQRLVAVIKITTVLEVCTTEWQHSVVSFLWAKVLNAKDIHKEMFFVCRWKCLSPKTVSNMWQNVSLKTKSLKRRCGVG